ncbi:MAG: hypothetical protein QF682_06330 [Candidatus Thermoplasmatota archaeon]|jgi:hypothetical protein|nr:hypothetical protein [Candidatus Thermoplasmatota archaeon]
MIVLTGVGSTSLLLLLLYSRRVGYITEEFLFKIDFKKYFKKIPKFQYVIKWMKKMKEGFFIIMIYISSSLFKKKKAVREEKGMKGIFYNIFLTTLIIGLAFSIDSGSGRDDIFPIIHLNNSFLKILPFVLLATLTIISFKTYIDYRIIKLHNFKVRYKISLKGNILLFLTALFFAFPYGLPVNIIYDKIELLSKRTLGIISIAKVLSIAIFLIPFYFILSYSTEGSRIWQTANICSLIVLMLITYNLFPSQLFDGYRIYTWNKLAWISLFIPSLSLFILHSLERLPVGFLSLIGCVGLIVAELSIFRLYRLNIIKPIEVKPLKVKK